MQVRLIVGLALAIGAVLFAMQNIAPVTVTLGAWSFEGSLALVLLLAFAAGALVAALLSSLSSLRSRLQIKRLQRQIGVLEGRLIEAQAQEAALQREIAELRAASAGRDDAANRGFDPTAP